MIEWVEILETVVLSALALVNLRWYLREKHDENQRDGLRRALLEVMSHVATKQNDLADTLFAIRDIRTHQVQAMDVQNQLLAMMARAEARREGGSRDA